MREIIRYGILGLLGGAFAALLAELILPIRSHFGITASAAGFSPQLGRHILEAGANSGEIEVVQLWKHGGTLQSSVIEPSGEELDRNHPKTSSGGVFEQFPQANSPPFDTIIAMHWPLRPMEGRYKIFVAGPPAEIGSVATTFVCGVKNGSEVQEFSGSIAGGEPRRLIYEFEYQRQILGLDSWYPAIRGGLWNGLLAIGVLLALVLGEASLGRRGLHLIWKWPLLLAAAGVMGFLLGAGVQWFWENLDRSDPVRLIGQFGGWLALGALLARLAVAGALSAAPGRAMLYGAVGGCLGACIYEAGILILVGPAARIVGASGLGIGVGISLAVALSTTPPPTAIPVGRPACRGTGFSLHLTSGQVIPLANGMSLTSTDLPGVRARFLRRVVAKVAPKSDNQSIFGLKNLSRSAWSVLLADGSRAAISPGRSIRLATGARIDFGPLRGEIR